MRARHTAALRGVGETVTIVDYADGSVTQAPQGRGVAGTQRGVFGEGAHGLGAHVSIARRR